MKVMSIEQRRHVATSISAVERGELLDLVIDDPTPRSHVVGITGAPGVGKSCLSSALVRVHRDRGETVAVVAVDPSSPISGGSILGDRLRMSEHVGDPAVFIRSVASRGRLGGTSGATPLVLAVLEGAGFDVIILETVGVGQSEVEVTSMVDTTVWCTAPGLGDEVQAAKAGVLELADLLVVNKADLPGAEPVASQLRVSLAHGRRDRLPGWTEQVHLTCTRTGEGLGELVAGLDEHRRVLDATGGRVAKRTQRVGLALRATAQRALDRWLDHDSAEGDRSVQEATSRILAGDLDLHQAALAILAGAAGSDRPAVT